MSDLELRIASSRAEVNRSLELAIRSLDATLLDGPVVGGFPARVWLREIALLEASLLALDAAQARLLD